MLADWKMTIARLISVLNRPIYTRQSDNTPTIQQSTNLPMLRATVLVIFLLTPLAAVLAASDWPQYLGPSRTGVYVGAPLNEKWPSTGPRVIWRKQIGQGLSGPVVAGSQLILFHRVENREVV